MNTIRRIEKSDIENEKDFYQTHPTMVYALLDWLNNSDKNLSILDPCCGEGIICDTLSTKFTNVKAFDKFSTEESVRQDFLEHNSNYDMIIMNPPYGKTKYKFIDHARTLADFVFCLLPINISNYNMFQNDYENIPEYVGRIKMTPKVFLHQGTEFKAGGTDSYAWYYWNKECNTNYSKEWYLNLRDYLGNINEKECI